MADPKNDKELDKINYTDPVPLKHINNMSFIHTFYEIKSNLTDETDETTIHITNCITERIIEALYNMKDDVFANFFTYMSENIVKYDNDPEFYDAIVSGITDKLPVVTHNNISLLEESSTKTEADFWKKKYNYQNMIDDIMIKRIHDGYLFLTLFRHHTENLSILFKLGNYEITIPKYERIVEIETALNELSIPYTASTDYCRTGKTTFKFDYNFGCYAELTDSQINIMCWKWIKTVDIDVMRYIFYNTR